MVRGFDEQIISSSVACTIIPLTMLGVFCLPDFVRGTQPFLSHGSSSSSSSSSLLYVAVGQEEATTTADFFVAREL